MTKCTAQIVYLLLCSLHIVHLPVLGGHLDELRVGLLPAAAVPEVRRVRLPQARIAFVFFDEVVDKVHFLFTK